MKEGQPLTLGVNYWPRRKAMYWWGQFEAGEVRDEFALIASLGLQVVRLFLLWGDFQPAPDVVDKTCLENLGKVCDIAAENSLKLDVTFFTGHMSGPNWAPGWLLGGPRPVWRQKQLRQVVSGGRPTRRGYRNPYHDPVALAAEKLQLHTVVGAYKDHPAMWMWNLGNEPDLFDWPQSPEAGREWVKEMVAAIRTLDAQRPITCGLHAASLNEHNHLQIDQVYGETDVAVMHSYPMYTPLARRPLDPDFVPFTCALTAALCGKPVLMEEFGGCTALHPASLLKRGSGVLTAGRAPSLWPRKKTWQNFCARACRAWSKSGRKARWSGASPTTRPNSGIARRATNLATSVSSGWCARMGP